MRIIHILRKPCSEPSIVANVLQYGTGGLNIDACRIGSEQRINLPAGNKPGGVSLNMSVVGMPATATATHGRWPANLLLQHEPTCQNLGPQQTKGSHGTTGVWGKPGGTGFVYSGNWPDRTHPNYTNPNGTETTESWQCSESCPALDLNTQSGVKTSGGRTRWL